MLKTLKKFPTNEINLLLRLAIPLALIEIIDSSVNFSSTLFLAHLGIRELAAGSLVLRVFITLIAFVWMTLSSISILTSQKYGNKDQKAISYILHDGMILALLFVVPAFLICWNIAPILLLAGQDPVLVALAKPYMHALACGLLPDFTSLVLIQFILGLGHARTNMVFFLITTPFSIFFNYAFIFGKFGFPALGMAGVGWGITLQFWISTALLFLYLFMCHDYSSYFENILQRRSLRFLSELWRIGMPMGIMACIELAFFLVLILLMGHFSSQELAANQITMQYLMPLTMITFAMAQAVTVRMGHMLGANLPNLAVRACYFGIMIAVSYMGIVALCYWFISDKLIEIDHIKDPAVIVFATQFLAVCAIFQILEAIRHVLFGALRSLKDTRFTLFSSIISFWGVAFPVGYFFAMGLHWNGLGLWWGMVIGAGCNAVLLYWRFSKKSRKINLIQEISTQCQVDAVI